MAASHILGPFLWKIHIPVEQTPTHCTDDKRRQLGALSQNGMVETALNLGEIFEAYVIGKSCH